MTSRQPPIPPANRSPKGPGADKAQNQEQAKGKAPVPENLEQQDQQGNTWQNTHHQGYQQDR